MQLLKDFDLSAHNTLRLSARSRWGATIDNFQDAEAVGNEARERSAPLRVLGRGSNVILHERFEGILALMRIEGREVSKSTDLTFRVVVGAGVDWQELVEWTLANNMPGLENLAGIPGTVGAAPIQNIGAYGVELSERFHSLVAFDTERLEQRYFSHEECDFGYRDSLFKREVGRFIITEVTFALPKSWYPNISYRGLEKLDYATPRQIMDAVLNIRNKKLPDWRRRGNVGSFFHNPIVNDKVAADLRTAHPDMPIFSLSAGRAKLSAAWMIDRCGLKGFRIASACISASHALVVVNLGGATEDDVATLATHVIQSVQTHFGITLKQEPEWI